MNNDNNAVATVHYELGAEAARSLQRLPLVLKVCWLSYHAVWVTTFVTLLIVDPVNREQHRFFGLVAFALSFLLRAGLRKVLLGRTVDSISGEVTQRLNESTVFKKALRSTLMETPWSKHRLVKGRYKKPQSENLLVLLKDGSSGSLSVAEDFSSISVAAPARS